MDRRAGYLTYLGPPPPLNRPFLGSLSNDDGNESGKSAIV